MYQSGGIRLFQSRATDAKQAVQAFHDGVTQRDMELVIFYCSPLYDLSVIAAEMRDLFGAVLVIGCTTAGEIGPAGYCDHSLSGVSFSSSHFKVAAGRLGDLQHFGISIGQTFVQSLQQRIESEQIGDRFTKSFALMLIDGLSVREEPVAHAFQYALGNTILLGGSAGDEKNFKQSFVYFEGSFKSDSTVLALIYTDLPFTSFKTQHFIASDIRLVVTSADAVRRIVKEINGLPAAEEYARLIGVDVSELNSKCFAASPLVMKINGTDYVRSIQKANADGSLTFYCAIDEGLVLRMAHGVEMVGTLEKSMEDIRNQIGMPLLVLVSDCVLRALEFEQGGVKDRIGEIYSQFNVLGFNSYGEQYLGIHVNQTLTGIAIGKPNEGENV